MSSSTSPPKLPLPKSLSGRVWSALLDVASLARERRTFRGHDGPVQALLFTPDARKLISGGEDTAIMMWEVKD